MTEPGPRSLVIVGGAGFLGRALVARLASAPAWAGREVRCLDSVAFPDDAPRPARFQAFVGDARDPDALSAALAGADAVWIRAAILGGLPSTDAARLPDYLAINVDVVSAVLGAAEASGCERVLFDSTEQVFGDSADLRVQAPWTEPVAANFYGATKLIAEKLIRDWASSHPQSPRSAQILRYSRVRQAGTPDVITHWTTAALAGQPIRVLGNSSRRISFVHLDDVLAASVEVLKRRPSLAIHHVNADRPASLLEIAQRIRDLAESATGIRVPIEFGPGGRSFEPHVVGLEWESTRRTLGLPPPVSLDSMLAETLDHLRGPS